MLNSFSSEISKNNEYNLISNNTKKNKIAESEITKSILKYGQKYNKIYFNSINKFNKWHSKIFL